MSKSCTIESGVVSPKYSSCSMILRSACSHGHSHENCAVKKHSSSSHKRKQNSLISPKSSENHHLILNGGIYKTVEINHIADQKITEVSSINLSCAKKLHFSHLSSPDSQRSTTFNHSSHTEVSSDYCSATESDINSSESLDVTSNMNTRRYVRSPHPSVRSLSDSDGESDIKVQRITRLRRKSIITKEYNTKTTILSHKENNKSSHNESYMGNSHSTISTNSRSSKYTGASDGESVNSYLTDSSYVYTSPVDYSLYNRFRLFSGNFTYYTFMKYMNDEGLLFLRRIRDFVKAKPFSLLLLSLLFFLVLVFFFPGVYQKSASSYGPVAFVSEIISTVTSSIMSFLSSIFSFFSILFTREEVEDSVLESSDESKIPAILPSLSSSGAFFSGWFSSAIVETKLETDLQKRSDYLEKDRIYPQSDIEGLLALNALKVELTELKSSIQQMEADKLMYQKLLSDISDLQLKFETFSNTVNAKEKDSLEKYQREKNTTDEKIIAVTAEYKNHMDTLKNKLKILENKLGVYEDLKKCCDKQLNQQDISALIEKSIILAFKEVLGGDINSKYHFFSEWLNSKFFNHENLMHEINAALKQQSSYTETKIDFSKVMQVVDSTVMKHVDALKKNFSEFNSYSYSSSFTQDFFSEDKIRKIVKEAIMLYDADKTGQVDYALESGGGSVLGTRCSETYVEKYGKISLFGVPFWTYSNSPRTAIQPDVQPGRCWAFKGSQGFLVLQLSATIIPTGFTLEHIPASLSPAGSIDSAPKNFSVWGLDTEKDYRGNLLGEYFYDVNGDPLQKFDVKIPSNVPYSYIELQIHSNHGNMEYTCLYRFRVHGKRA